MEAEVGATTKGWDEVSDEEWLLKEGHVRLSLWNKREPGQAYCDGARHQVRKKLEKQGVFTCPCDVSLVGCGSRTRSSGRLGRDFLNCSNLLAVIDYIRPSGHPSIPALFRIYFQE